VCLLCRMAQGRKVFLFVAVTLLGTRYFLQPTFVPPAVQRSTPAVIPAVTMLGAAPAFADDIGGAASKLANAAWPFMKEVDWNSGLYLTAPGKFDPLNAIKAVDKAIEMGAAMDPELLRKAVLAHHNGVQAIDKSGLTSQAAFGDIAASLGRLIASVPESKTMDVYNAFSGIVDSSVPQYLMSKVKEADAKAAYEALLEFTKVVKANPTTAAEPQATLSSASADKIGEAAGKLSNAAYPFLKDIDWLSDLYVKPLGGDAQKVMKGVDKALVMGAALDPKYLKEAAQAHHKAISDIDAKGLTTQADFQAINAALGKAIAAVPTSKVMDVYNAFAGATASGVPNKLLSTVKEADAKAAYEAFLQFKDVVQAAR